LSDDVINYQAGDVFIGLDLQPTIVVAQKDFYQQLRRHGVKVQFVVYDLLCILMPQHFVEGGAEGHNRWLEVVAESDGVICISKAVADEVDDWMKGYSPERLRPFNISWFHLGADIENSMPTQGLPVDANKILKVIQEQSSFLMVGTIEPRKGHAQTLAAFEQLWADGVDVSLVIVGKQGWMVEELVERLQHHSELGKRLFWLEGISDEYLEKTYAGSTCLVAASEGEGFGLPLIEAAQYKLPIIARDIPVFREVAGEHAYYFNSKEPEVLAVTIKTWLKACKTDEYPSSESMLWLTWRDSAKQLMDVLLRH
jgi:glycosyltransferase involved in cell wall biosynthesis